MSLYQHDATLPEQSREAQDWSWVGSHKQVLLVPAVQTTVGRESWAPPQTALEAALHAAVPAIGHRSRQRVPCRYQPAGPSAQPFKQPVCRWRSPTNPHDSAVGDVVGISVGASQARRYGRIRPRGFHACRQRRSSTLLNTTSRCTWTDIRMPKPSITVIIADPPCDTSGNGTPPTGITPITMAILTNT